ncbi:MAG: hypothetical protein ACK4TD_01690 [Ectopseudomonas guguanensis]|uniref:hypothetical protein n=1 Tax=Ectopseudomonas guguanensis TaxID=1198456 RepID=UPI00391BB0B3
MLKTLGLVLTVLLVVAASVSWLLFVQFGPAIQAAIESEGASATRTQVLVGGVAYSPFTGSGTIDGLSVGNPSGFSSPYALVVQRIALQVEPASLLGTGPIVVDSATLIAPQITYAAQGPNATSNLEIIRNTAQAYATSPAAVRAGRHARRLIIRELRVMGGAIAVDVAMPGGALSLPLPARYLADIGGTSEGAEPAAIIRAVSEAVADQALQAVSLSIAEKLKAAVAPPLARPPKFRATPPVLPPPPTTSAAAATVTAEPLPVPSAAVPKPALPPLPQLPALPDAPPRPLPLPPKPMLPPGL